MIHLREITISPSFSKKEGYPYNVRCLKGFERLEFTEPITLFVGENGSGKSTLLEGMANAVGSVTIGSSDITRDPTLNAIKPLADALRLVWNKRTRKGFFLRAEDFFGYIRQLRAMKQSFYNDLDEIDREFEGRSDYAKTLAKGPSAGSLRAMNRSYGGDLDAHSHGESFLTLFQSRFVPGGLYLLDEPEAALSPLSQLGLISLIKQMVPQDAQFIIATHSPILMALPGSMIFDFDQMPPAEIVYSQLESVALYRAFLSDPEAYLRHL